MGRLKIAKLARFKKTKRVFTRLSLKQTGRHARGIIYQILSVHIEKFDRGAI